MGDQAGKGEAAFAKRAHAGALMNEASAERAAPRHGAGSDAPRHGEPHLVARRLERSSFMAGLFRRHWGELVGRLRKVYGPGPPEPEEIAQAAFEQIARMPDLERIENPRAFLFRVAVNLAINAGRRFARARKHLDHARRTANQDDLKDWDPETVFIGKQELGAVRRAMDRLPEKQKMILYRSRIKGESYAEIRRDTGWSETDISRTLTRALAALQAAVDDNGTDSN